jgi:hypothetical protein
VSADGVGGLYSFAVGSIERLHRSPGHQPRPPRPAEPSRAPVDAPRPRRKVKILSAKFLGPKGGKTSDAVRAFDYLTALKTKAGIKLVGEAARAVGPFLFQRGSGRVLAPAHARVSACQRKQGRRLRRRACLGRARPDPPSHTTTLNSNPTAINNSWGGGGYSSALYAAIERAKAADILVIVAAGNSGACLWGRREPFWLPGKGPAERGSGALGCLLRGHALSLGPPPPNPPPSPPPQPTTTTRSPPTPRRTTTVSPPGLGRHAPRSL